jgi:aldehyde:ferredoxin oxidoreductase
MTWGNVDAVQAMLRKIAHREGVGHLLAEGVMRASREVGGDAPELGIYTLRGASPRTHDHRGRWAEMLDTATSGTSTLEATAGKPPTVPGVPPLDDRFSPQKIADVSAKQGGWLQFEDSMVICRFCTPTARLLMDCVNAVTGWNMSIEEAKAVGRRSINILRVFNLRHGLDPDLERPSPRYGSMPVNGPVEGISVGEHWDEMVRLYRQMNGWDADTGTPLPETLRELGLDYLISDL